MVNLMTWRRNHKKAQKIILHGRKLFVCFVLFCGCVKADDGYRLWLRYDQLPSHAANVYGERIKSIAVQGKSAMFDVIRGELSEGCGGLLGTRLEVGDRDGASVVVGLPQTSPLIRKLQWEAELKSLGS